MTNKTAEKLIADILLFPILRHCPNKPGEVIKNLPLKQREMVKELKSKHFNHRLDEAIPYISNEK